MRYNYEGVIALKVQQEAKDWANAVINANYIETGEAVENGAATKKMQYVGWIGEWMVRDLYGIEHPKPEEMGPDGGVDIVRKGFTTDVKTQATNYPYGSGRLEWGSNFRKSQLRTNTDILVFAHYWEENDVLFIPGWTWKKNLYAKDFAKEISKGESRGSMNARNKMFSVPDSKLRRLNPSTIHNYENII